MNIKFLGKIIFPISLLSFFILSCGDDDNGASVVPPRSLAEVATENNEALLQYFSTHTFNYQDFENPPTDFDFRVIIDSITDQNSNIKSFMDFLLMDSLKTETVDVSSTEFLLGDEEMNIAHTYYYLEIRRGSGQRPTTADSILVRYTGQDLKQTVFDAKINTPVWFDLASIQSPRNSQGGKGFRGFALGASKFRTGGDVIINENDGTATVENYGIGIVFFPSALQNFNIPFNNSIESYSPLVFTLDVFLSRPIDHDGDGIQTNDEDLNSNGYLYDDNTDLEDERNSGGLLVANFLDIDDDNDGVLTLTEISNSEGLIIFPYPDSNNDGTPDFLDPNIQWDESEENE